MSERIEKSTRSGSKSQKTRIVLIRALSLMIILLIMFLIFTFFEARKSPFWGNPTLKELGNTTIEERSSSNTFQRRAVWFQTRFAPWSVSHQQIKTSMDSRIGFWENLAVITLSATGYAQEDYFDENPDEGYATFQELKDTLSLRQDYTIGNMIENYFISWETNNVSTVLTEHSVDKTHTYTIIAYPRDTRPGYLSTFAITEDRTVRIYNPDNDNDPDITGLWDPVY